MVRCSTKSKSAGGGGRSWSHGRAALLQSRVDGQTRHVDAARIDAHTLSLLVDSVSPENSSVTRSGYEVSVVPDPVGGQLGGARRRASRSRVALNGRRRWGRKDDGRASGSGPQRLVAPMPGKVVRVLVKAGDVVGPRQPVVVVEAMKMENELRASREGTVAEIHAREGHVGRRRRAAHRHSVKFLKRLRGHTPAPLPQRLPVADRRAPRGRHRLVGDGRPRPGGAPQGGDRRVEVHRAADAHRLAEDPPAHRQGARRGSDDRRPARRRSPVLHRQAARGRRSTGCRRWR